MATGDIIESARVRDFIPENGILQDPNKVRQVGVLGGYPLKKQDADGFYILVKVPANGTPLGTGLTVQVTVVDDPSNSDVGKVALLGVSGVKVVSGTTNITAPTFGTETTASVTLPATSGIPITTNFAVTTANLNTPVAGNLVLLHVRRNGSSATDTHRGEILVTGVVVTDT